MCSKHQIIMGAIENTCNAVCCQEYHVYCDIYYYLQKAHHISSSHLKAQFQKFSRADNTASYDSSYIVLMNHGFSLRYAEEVCGPISRIKARTKT